MIQSTKGKLAANAVKGKYGKGFPGDLVKRTRAMLSALDAAVVVEDLRFPPGNHLEELKGDRAGQHSVADQRAMAHLLCLDAERPRRCRDCGLPLRGYADELA